MARIFMSYSRSDEAFVRRLATDLRASGAHLWLDVDDIPFGKEWDDAIQAGLDQCESMILVISPNSMASEEVGREWKYFLTKKKSIFPILYATADIPYRLTQTQYVDFRKQVTPNNAGSVAEKDETYYAGTYQQALLKLQRAIHGGQALVVTPVTATPVATPTATTPLPNASRGGVNSIPGGWITIGAAIVVGVLILGAIVLPMLNGNQQASQQTQTAVALAQNAPTSTVSSTHTQTPSATATDVPPSATFTLTVTPSATDTIAPTSTNTPQPTATPTTQPSVTANVEAIAANPTATAVPPTATVPTLPPTVAPTAVKTWPCDVTVKKVGTGNSNKYSVLRKSADPNSEVTGTVEVNDRLRISAKQADSQSGNWYKVIGVAGTAIPAAWIPAEYVTLTSQCPS